MYIIHDLHKYTVTLPLYDNTAKLLQIMCIAQLKNEFYIVFL